MGKINVNKNIKKVALAIADIAVVAGAAFLACAATIGDALPKWILYFILVNAVVLVAVFAFQGLYSALFSHVGIGVGFRIILTGMLLGFANLIVVGVTNSKYYNVWTIIFFVSMVIICSVSIRFAYRVLSWFKILLFSKASGKRVIIIGGGDAGATIIREMFESGKINYNPVCVLDDNPNKLNQFLSGVKIIGKTADVKKYVDKFDAEEIFICMPSVSKKRISEIVDLCRATGKEIKILPGIYQFATCQAIVEKMREVEIADLLGRDQVKVKISDIIGYIKGKTVLVSGGGGSIGSELCRQIAMHNPEKLIILDIYENNAYDIEQELIRRHPTLKLITLIASVRDEQKIEDVYKTYRPQIVFHAAAHKHVPLMETSPNEAVKNNVFGTLNMAKYADKYKVETFVQISTDKAVNPTNIMGATKRICEMIVQAFGRKSNDTKFVAVRFGNVLGSNGSVIPLFKKQIAEGGPVTVTHKDIIRYFMTIPEAVSLVLQAGAYAEKGQIYVLDMGEPVKIYDLACNLIRLSGYEPNVDIAIECVGLRPGEKLFEERLMAEEGLQKTANGSISIARPLKFDEERFWLVLERLYTEAYSETGDMKQLVKELVPTYQIDNRK